MGRKKKQQQQREGLTTLRRVVAFDEESRREFLTGFHKRKVERRKIAMEEIKHKLKEEQKKMKEEGEEHGLEKKDASIKPTLPKKSKDPFLSQRISSLTASLHSRSQKKKKGKLTRHNQGIKKNAQKPRVGRTSKGQRRKMTGKRRHAQE
ncbi:hypothetical protein JD844_028370 [Phrynosoma platyrhinos]|uniref:Nucleolar protein 12 n=1 Tax=Phrynosoma platyrhinos TaxID=52577 RepID=A0ABQ7SHT2_PHRPL|nr:hypothetical protein JD844_028370 [Phrynosoma platyrhinos]